MKFIMNGVVQKNNLLTNSIITIHVHAYNTNDRCFRYRLLSGGGAVGLNPTTT